jgi:hypothetical protein
VFCVLDLTFGDYVRLLENPKHWSEMKLLIDRKSFVAMLEEVRQTRNDVMHFNPDTPSPGYLDPVRKLTALLRKLHRAWVYAAKSPIRT